MAAGGSACPTILRGAIFPAQPEKKRGKKRDEPTIAVLFVGRPFLAQNPAENEPEQGEDAEKQDAAQRDSVRAGDGWGRFDGDLGQLARSIPTAASRVI